MIDLEHEVKRKLHKIMVDNALPYGFYLVSLTYYYFADDVYQSNEIFEYNFDTLSNYEYIQFECDWYEGQKTVIINGVINIDNIAIPNNISIKLDK